MPGRLRKVWWWGGGRVVGWLFRQVLGLSLAEAQAEQLKTHSEGSLIPLDVHPE